MRWGSHLTCSSHTLAYGRQVSCQYPFNNTPGLVCASCQKNICCYPRLASPCLQGQAENVSHFMGQVDHYILVSLQTNAPPLSFSRLPCSHPNFIRLPEGPGRVPRNSCYQFPPMLARLLPPRGRLSTFAPHISHPTSATSLIHKGWFTTGCFQSAGGIFPTMLERVSSMVGIFRWPTAFVTMMVARNREYSRILL